MAATYDIGDYCARCGIGGIQKGPFRFRSEPKARRSQFLQLNWVFDQLFIRSEVRTILDRAGIVGIGYRPAILNKTEQPLESVEQLVIKRTLPPALITLGLQTVTCKPDNEEGPIPASLQKILRYPPDHPFCGRVKFHWPQALRFRSSVFGDALDVVQSFEWFGSGGAAARALLFSERLWALVEEQKWRGLVASPLELE